MQFEEKKSSVDLVVDALIEYIMANGLKAGDRLPNGKDLCALLNVSLGTLRESIQRLAVRNVLEVRRSVGVFVSPKNGTSDDPLGFALVRDRTKLIQDLADFRLVIEPRAAAMAAQNATKDDIAELDYFCSAVNEKLLTNEPHMNEDSAYHACIARCSGNLIFARISPLLRDTIEEYSKDNPYKTFATEVAKFHRAIFDAIARHDSIGASDAMYYHLLFSRDLRGGQHILGRFEQLK